MDKSTQNNQPEKNNDPTQYQDILNQYAASVKPEEENPPAENQNNSDPKKFLEEVKSVAAETPIHPSLADNLDEELSITPKSTPENQTPSPEPTPQPNNPPIIPASNIPSEEAVPQKTPEEIKQKVEEILSTTSSTTPVSSSSNLPKIAFIVSLIIFFGVMGLLTYTILTNSPNKNNSTNPPTSTPTSVTEVGCKLNDKEYKIGELFNSEDGCNTCSCEEKDVITCTQRACTSTPSAKTSTSSATKSATSSSIPKDWKIYTDKEIGFSFNYPKNIILTKKILNGLFSLVINNQVSLAGGINMVTGITTDRGGSSLDFGGYTKNGHQINYFYNKNNSIICKSKLIKNIYINPNGVEIAILSGIDDGEDGGMIGACETYSGEIKALINTKNKTYPGLAFTTNSIIKESDLLKILDTLKFN